MDVQALIGTDVVSVIFWTYDLRSLSYVFCLAYSVIEKPPLDFDGRYN